MKKILLIIVALSLNAGFLMSQDYFGRLGTPTSNFPEFIEETDDGKFITAIWGDGIYLSNNRGATWAKGANQPDAKFITDISMDAAGNIYISAWDGGVYKSSDGAVNWSALGTGLENENVRAVTVHPEGIVFAGTYGHGAYMLEPGETEWKPTLEGQLYRDITAMDHTELGYILAGTYGGGVWATRDKGASWLKQSSGLKNLFINNFQKNNSSQIFAATNGRGVYKSPNDGVAWSELDTFMTPPLTNETVPIPDLNVTAMEINKNGRMIFGTKYGGIYVNDDEVDFTWVPSNARGISVSGILNSNSELFYLAGNREGGKSVDIGEKFDSFDDPVKSKPELGIFKYHSDLIAYDSTGGVWWSSDEGTTWNVAGGTLGKFQFIKRDSAGNLFAGTKSGIRISLDYGRTWADGGFNEFEVLDIEIDILGNPVVALYRVEEQDEEILEFREIQYSSDGGFNWQEIPMDFSEGMPNPDVLAIDSKNRIYVSRQNYLTYTTDLGQNWNDLKTLNGVIGDVAVIGQDVIFVATSNGVYRSLNSGVTFTTLDFDINNVRQMLITSEERIYLAANYYSQEYFASYETLHYTDDLGENWVSLGADFPMDEITSLQEDENGNFYMSTANGLIFRALHPKNLDIPNLVSPANNSNDIPVEIKFEWEAADNAELYTFILSDDDDFEYVWETATLKNIEHDLFRNLEHNKKYYWRVKSKNHSAESGWSQEFTFTTKLAAPLLLSPEDEASGVAVNAPLDWDASDGADFYEVQVSVDEEFTGIEYEMDSVEATDIITPQLSSLSRYYWRVRAKNDVSVSGWSEVRQFNTVSGPPRHISPKDDTTSIALDTMLVWEDANGADDYEARIATDEEFTDIVFTGTSGGATEIATDGLEYNQMYYWQVRSVNSDGESVWSEPWKFLTVYSPVVTKTPALEEPASANPVYFSWEEHPEGLEFYQLQVYKTGDYDETVVDEIINGELDFTQQLEDYTDYEWRIRVLSSFNSGEWTELSPFRTMIETAMLRLPPDGSVGQPLEIYFLWFAAEGAERYHLQIANDEGFTDLIFSQDTISSVNINVPGLQPERDYFWRVRAISPESPGMWSETWRFKTGIAEDIQKVYPPDESENIAMDVEFRWITTKDFLTYDLEVSTMDDSIVLMREGIEKKSFRIVENYLNAKTQYKWRVRGKMSGVESEWTPYWTFTTGDDTGIAAEEGDLGLICKPNPVENKLTIITDEHLTGAVSITLSDISGRQIYSGQLNTLGTAAEIEIGMNGLAPGAYIVTAANSRGIITRMVIKK